MLKVIAQRLEECEPIKNYLLTSLVDNHLPISFLHLALTVIAAWILEIFEYGLLLRKFFLHDGDKIFLSFLRAINIS